MRVRRLLALSLGTALVAALAATLPTGLPATAQESSPPPGSRADVVVDESDNGRTIALTVGQRLGVLLHPNTADELWADIDSNSGTGGLLRSWLSVDPSISRATFTAMRATESARVESRTDTACRHEAPACAVGQRTWFVNVVVTEPTATPSPTASPDQCQRRPIPQLAPGGGVLLEESSDGRTITVERGTRIHVVFGGCRAGADYRAPMADDLLFREGAGSDNPGGATAVFLASRSGSGIIWTTTDAPCLHGSPPCAFPAQVWTVSVQVVEPCTPPQVTGPAAVGAGGTAALSGTAAPGSVVHLWFRPYGGTEFTVRRSLTTGSDGTYRTTFRPLVDHRWYAAQHPGCQSSPGLTRVVPRVVVSASVRRGERVPLAVLGPAGQAVGLWAYRSGDRFRLVRSGRLDSSGRWSTSFLATVDHRFYASTGPDGRRSPAVLTQVTPA